jgi:hypothetical protein
MTTIALTTWPLDSIRLSYHTAVASSGASMINPAKGGVVWESGTSSARLRRVTEWATFASLATAGGTLVLAVATFAAVRSGNRSARTAERSLLAAQRPLLVSSRPQDPEQDIQFVDGTWLSVAGGGAALEVAGSSVHMAVSVRNVGTGLAILQGWSLLPGLPGERSHPSLADFTSQIRDIYVAPGDSGLWLGALADPAAGKFTAVAAAIEAGADLTLSLLYGDFEGGQRVISQFVLRCTDGRWLSTSGRHFNVDLAGLR